MINNLTTRMEKMSAGRLFFNMIIIFLLVHLMYYALGVRFDDSSLSISWQYLDSRLLIEKLLESCFYLHMQPPLFNVFLGAVIKTFPKNETMVFQGIYILFGLVLYYSMFFLQVRLGVTRLIALISSTLFMASPSFVLYEHWLFYTFPLAALLTLSACFLLEFLEKKSSWVVFCFFVSIFFLCGIRSMFHICYFLFLVAGLALIRADVWKKIVLAALVPFLLLLSVYCKNYILFGKFSTSSWMGMNFWTMSVGNMPLTKRRQLVALGKLSRLSLIERFSPLEMYPAEYLQVNGYENIPALGEIRKSTGRSNYNHPAYISISDQYMKDAVYGALNCPESYLIGVVRSWQNYFKSSSDNISLEPNRRHLLFIDGVYNRLFYGRAGWNPSRIRRWLGIETNRTLYTCFFLLFWCPFLVIYSVKVVLKPNPQDSELSRNRRITILYICFSIVYVAMIGNSFEIGENNRFRFMTDPLYLVLFGLFFQYFVIRRLGSVLRLRLERLSRPREKE